MKLLLLLLCFPLLAFSPLGDEKGPSEPLKEMLALHHIEHNGSWESIICETQKELRKPSQELWDLEENDQNPKEIYRLCTQLRMTQQQWPQKSHYTYGVILGATKERMRTRLHFLLDQDVTYDTLVLLVGNRPLQPWEGPEKDETEAMRSLINEVEITVPILVIDTQCEGRRLRTEDTYLAWGPQVGEALLVSDQPFLERQGALANNCLTIPFEMVGKGITLEELEARPNGCRILWETLIRWIYAEFHKG